MKKLFILLLFLSFNCESVASHKDHEDPSFRNYQIHFLWSDDDEVRHNALLDLAEKENFYAQYRLLLGYLNTHSPETYPELSYSEAFNLYKKILENKCGWFFITTGIRLLDEKRPKDHGMDEKSLDIILHALASLDYEYFSAFLYRIHLATNLTEKDLEHSDEYYKALLLKVRKRLNQSDIKESYDYAAYLRSKWPTWNSLYNPNLDLLKDLRDSYRNSCLSSGEEEYQTEALKLYKKHLGIKD